MLVFSLSKKRIRYSKNLNFSKIAHGVKMQKVTCLYDIFFWGKQLRGDKSWKEDHNNIGKKRKGSSL